MMRRVRLRGKGDGPWAMDIRFASWAFTGLSVAFWSVGVGFRGGVGVGVAIFFL
jgi:hypothetical protein